jgi:hypothetical protein
MSLHFVAFTVLLYINIEYAAPSGVLASSSSNSSAYFDFDNNDSIQNNSLSFEQIPSNISVNVEPKDTGTLYLSALITKGNVEITRDLDDELFPFQLTNWYQLVKFTPNYTKPSDNQDFKFNNLIVGQLQDFDNFDELLDQAKVYMDIPINETFILDVPNKDVSFMQLQTLLSNNTSAIYYGLYDGNQQTDKSEINLRLNPETSLKILESQSAMNIKTNEPLYNVTSTLVCNDLFKLGYEKCQ